MFKRGMICFLLSSAFSMNVSAHQLSLAQPEQRLMATRGAQGTDQSAELWADFDRKVLIRKVGTSSSEKKEMLIHRVMLRLPNAGDILKNSQHRKVYLNQVSAHLSRWLQARLPEAHRQGGNSCSQTYVSEYFAESHVAVLNFCAPHTDLSHWTAEDVQRLTSLSMDHWAEMEAQLRLSGVEVIPEYLVRIAL